VLILRVGAFFGYFLCTSKESNSPSGESSTPEGRKFLRQASCAAAAWVASLAWLDVVTLVLCPSPEGLSPLATYFLCWCKESRQRKHLPREFKIAQGE
jgi:hypothetical protein